MDYSAAIKRPFSDWKKLLVGMVLYVVPFLNILTGMFAGGYLFRCMQSALKNNLALPEWDKWGELFTNGLLTALIGTLYALPALILIIVFAGAALAGFLANASLQNFGGIFAAFGMLFIGLLALILLTIYLVPSAILQFARTGKFGAAFAFGKVFNTAFTGSYFLVWLVAIGISIIIGIIGLLIGNALQFTIILPFVVWAVLNFCIGVTTMTLFGMAGAELK
ncbi:MAG TPA: DUF4013 domain-containing protein [Candidatus Nanoarchaeia archaeon]|nr:DUF4013 domain-containing protein [Candidatus Nanoarchaeia archaeon]